MPKLTHKHTHTHIHTHKFTYRFMHVIYRKKPKNWNVRNAKVICCSFKCCRQVWQRNSNKPNVYRLNIMTVLRFILVISLDLRKLLPNVRHLRWETFFFIKRDKTRYEELLWTDLVFGFGGGFICIFRWWTFWTRFTKYLMNVLNATTYTKLKQSVIRTWSHPGCRLKMEINMSRRLRPWPWIYSMRPHISEFRDGKICMPNAFAPTTSTLLNPISFASNSFFSSSLLWHDNPTEQPKHFKFDAVHTPDRLWPVSSAQKCPDIVYLVIPWIQPAAWNQLVKVGSLSLLCAQTMSVVTTSVTVVSSIHLLCFCLFFFQYFIYSPEDSHYGRNEWWAGEHRRFQNWTSWINRC